MKVYARRNLFGGWHVSSNIGFSAVNRRDRLTLGFWFVQIDTPWRSLEIYGRDHRKDERPMTVGERGIW